MVEVTVPILVEASMTFEVESTEEVTDLMVDQRIVTLQRIIDRRGTDPETGIYMVILAANGPPEFYDRDREV